MHILNYILIMQKEMYRCLSKEKIKYCKKCLNLKMIYFKYATHIVSRKAISRIKNIYQPPFPDVML